MTQKNTLLDQIKIDKIKLNKLNWEEFTLQSFKFNFTLQTLFFILLSITLYLAADVVLHQQNNIGLEEEGVRIEATEILFPLTTQLQNMQTTIAKQVTQLNHKPALSIPQLQYQLSKKLNAFSVVNAFAFSTNNANTFMHSTSPDLADGACWPLAKTDNNEPPKRWQSRVDFTNKDQPRLEYQYIAKPSEQSEDKKPDTTNAIYCVRISLVIDDMVKSFYGNQLTPLYHIVLDHQNRIAYHPNPHFISEFSRDLLINEPLMALINHKDTTNKTTGTATGNITKKINDTWHITSHTTELDNGQWKIATLSDRPLDDAPAEKLREIILKEQTIEHLTRRLEEIRLQVEEQLKLTQRTPGAILSVLKTKLAQFALVDEFFFAQRWDHWQQSDCLFSTKDIRPFVSYNRTNCKPFQSDEQALLEQWQIKLDVDKSLIHHQFTLSNPVSNDTGGTLFSMGFSIDLDKIMDMLDHDHASTLYYALLDQDNNIAYTPNISDMVDNTGSIPGRAPIASVLDFGLNTRSPSEETIPVTANVNTHFLFKQATGQSLWLHNQPMDDGSWHIATITETKDDFAEIEARNKIWLLFVLSTLFTLVVYAMLLLRVRDGETREYWHLVLIFSSMSVIAIGVIWGIQLKTPQPNENNELLLKDEVALYNAVAQKSHQYNTDLRHKNIKKVPVVSLGLRVDSINETENGTLRLIGLVWLKNANCAKSVLLQNNQNICLTLQDVKLEFPEAESVSITPHIEHLRNDVKRFTMEINFPLDSSIYPFERGVIPLRITTAGYNNPYRLIPDLDAYGMMNPHSKPGLAEKLELKGWNIFQSYFSYQPMLNTAKYSDGDALYDGELTELFFNIEVGRKFLNPFIADMVPIIVITALLFLVLMTMTKNEQHMDELGFDASTMLGYCSGLFFVLIVAHVYLREKLNIDKIAYIEYFYFMMYFVILSISASAILFSSRFQQRFMTYEDGVMVKILFWPTIFIITLIFTFLSFY